MKSNELNKIKNLPTDTNGELGKKSNTHTHPYLSENGGTVNGNINMNGNIIPNTHDSKDIGAERKAFRNIHARGLQLYHEYYDDTWGNIFFESSQKHQTGGLHLKNYNTEIIVGDYSVDLYATSNQTNGCSVISGAFIPTVHNTLDLGNNNFRWRDVYVGTNSTSINGYTKLSNKMIIQWGNIPLNAGTSGKTVNFPIAFPNNCLCVTVCLEDLESLNPSAMCRLTNYNKTSVTVNNTTSTRGLYGNFIAIGY